MKLRYLLSATMLAATVVLVNCGDSSPLSPATPAAAPAFDLLGTLTQTVSKTTGLISCSVKTQVSASKTFGSAGGSMKIGPHTFTVPAGALSGNVTITATLLKGNYNHIDFQPEGLRFAKSALLEMSYANCDLLGSLLPKHIAYTTDDLRIITLLLSVDNLFDKSVTGKIDHFSDYVMAW